MQRLAALSRIRTMGTISIVLALFLPLMGRAVAGVPLPSSTIQGDLYAVSASSPHDLWAVGDQFNAKSSLLVLHGNGIAWTVQTHVPSASDGMLLGVHAVSPADVWAVGVQKSGALIVHGNRTSWTIAHLTSFGPHPIHFLYAVAGDSATDIWAVGDGILHWNGHQWQQSTVPVPYGDDLKLTSITVHSSTDAWAVGHIDAAGDDAYLHWNGVRWSLYPSAKEIVHNLPPNGGIVGPEYLTGVTSIGGNDVWATGYAQGGATRTGNTFLLSHWNGHTWTLYPPHPVVNESDAHLSAISANSTQDVWVGGEVTFEPWLAHWDGATWQSMETPNFGDHIGAITGLRAFSSSDVWAVGIVDFNTSDPPRPLIEHWDGYAWHVLTSALHVSRSS